MNDTEYRCRVDEACEDITATAPSPEVDALMARAGA